MSKSLNTRMTVVESDLGEMKVLLAAIAAKVGVTGEPAKTTTRKAPRKGKAPAKVTASSPNADKAPGVITRKEWNHSLSSMLKQAGKLDTGETYYKAGMALWAHAQDGYKAGLTPREALAGLTAIIEGRV